MSVIITESSQRYLVPSAPVPAAREPSRLAGVLLCVLVLWVLSAFWLQFVEPGLLAARTWPAGPATVATLESAYSHLRQSLPATPAQTVVLVARGDCRCDPGAAGDLDAMGARAARRGVGFISVAAAGFGAPLPDGVNLLVFDASGRLQLATRATAGAICGSPLLFLERALNLVLSQDAGAAPLYLPEPCNCRRDPAP